MKIETSNRTNYYTLLCGIAVIVFAIIFWFKETQYFGFSDLPSCKFEGLCDTASVVILAFGIYLIQESKVTSTTITNE